jgi:hypothetical protein
LLLAQPGDDFALLVHDHGCILAGVLEAHSALAVYEALNVADRMIESIL